MTSVTELTHHSDAAASLPAARTAAAAATRRAAVEIRELDEVTDLEAVRRLCERIWRTGETNPPVTADLLRAMAKVGSYISGAYNDGVLVGVCFGFFSAPARRSLHSHIAGVLPSMAGRNVGFALKLHQRAWALERGTDEITWTFDPLVRRNAYFNLGKLAAEPTEYLPDFYGPMDDDINRSDSTDRLLVRWSLTSGAVVSASAGAPPVVTAPPISGTALTVSASGGPLATFAAGPTVLVGLPADAEALRLTDPGCAAEWRSAVREVLGGLLADGAQVRGFVRESGYVVHRREVP
jgi:predicted GNAT superfamily acetyltransferase